MNIKNKMIFTGLLGLLSVSVLMTGCAKDGTRDAEPVAEVEVIRGEGTGVFARIGIPAATMFDFDKAELKEEGKEAIETFRKTLSPDLTEAFMVLIVGHTDSSGDESYNMALSLKRAESVSDYLVATGADADKIRVIGRGPKEPIASNETREGRMQNRRVDILVVAEVRALDTLLFPSVALFDRDSADLTEQGKALLEENRQAAIDLLSRATFIEIIGHTDDKWESDYNMELSKKRAASVHDYLVSKGHDASKMLITGMGETMPIVSNNTRAGRAKNRRVEILVLGRIEE